MLAALINRTFLYFYTKKFMKLLESNRSKINKLLTNQTLNFEVYKRKTRITLLESIVFYIRISMLHGYALDVLDKNKGLDELSYLIIMNISEHILDLKDKLKQELTQQDDLEWRGFNIYMQVMLDGIHSSIKEVRKYVV